MTKKRRLYFVAASLVVASLGCIFCSFAAHSYGVKHLPEFLCFLGGALGFGSAPVVSIAVATWIGGGK